MCVAIALLGTNINSLTIGGTRITLVTPSEDGDHSDTPLEEAESLVERMDDMKCSVPHVISAAMHLHEGSSRPCPLREGALHGQPRSRFWQWHLTKSCRHYTTMGRSECPHCTSAALPRAAPYRHEDQGHHRP